MCIRDSSKSKRIKISELNKLEPGDYVTHIDHGVGVFKGLTKIEVNGSKQEVIKLNYGERDTVYLSIHLFHKISKYNKNIAKDTLTRSFNDQISITLFSFF